MTFSKHPGLKLLFLAAAFLVAVPWAARALDPKYELNGLVYMLVSDNDQNKDTLDGVYQVNRTTSGSPEKLFYPALTYGLGVDLNLKLYLFSEKTDNNPQDWTGDTEKIVGYQQPMGYFTGAAWWHRCITQVNGSSRLSPSGHFPCEASLNPAGSWAELADYGTTKKMKIPGGIWYHSADQSGSMWASGWFGSTDPTQSSSGGITRNGQISWKMYSDAEKRWYHKYCKHTWYPGCPVDAHGTPVEGPEVAESYEVNINRSIRNGCFDSCGIDVSQVPLPADKWHTSMVFNRYAKSYFFGKKLDSNGNTVIPVDSYVDIEKTRYTSISHIGAMNVSTAADIGVSMKTATDDYIYILGKEVIDNWLKKYYGVTYNIDYGGSVVSDQWWMKGGTVFAYDKTTGTIYQIERNETGGYDPATDPYAASLTEKITPHTGLGTDLNDIACDGFGSLYYTKTSKTPENPSDFTFAMRSSVSWGNPSGNTRTGVVHYRQNIYKTVFKKDINGTLSTEGNLQIGYNDYDQNIVYSPYAPTSDMNDTAKWSILAAPYLVGSSLSNVKKTELAVVNVATPPKVTGNKVANVDITGPYSDNGTGLYATAVDPNSIAPMTMYKFEIENFPIHNGKINQRTSTSADVDAAYRCIDKHPFNNFVGGFVSTLKILGANKSECVKYHWEVFQTVDANNQATTTPPLIFERSYYRPYIFCSLDSGEYDIKVTANYQWYDMDNLEYGSTVGSLTDGSVQVLKPGDSQYDTGISKDGTSYALMHVKVSGGVPPQTLTSNVRIRRQNSDGNWVTSDATENPGPGDYFVIDEDTDQHWMIDDPNLFNGQPTTLITKIRDDTPPETGDPDERPGTRQWNDNKVQVAWSAKILKPVTPMEDGQYYEYGANQTIGSSKQQELTTGPNSANYFEMYTGPSYSDAQQDQWKNAFAIPSDPGLYELRLRATRNLIYERNIKMRQDKPDGSYEMVIVDTIPVSKNVEISGIARVLVRDRTPPTLVFLDGVETEPRYLYAETGQALSTTVDGNTVNPSKIRFEIIDNNPMAFLTWTRTGSGVNGHNQTNRKLTLFYQAAGSGLQTVQAYSLSIPTSDIQIAASGTETVCFAELGMASFTQKMPIHKGLRLTNPADISAGPFSSSDVTFDPLYMGVVSVTDTSKNANTPLAAVNSAEIHLVDTIRPNLILSIADEKYSTTRYAPANQAFCESTSFIFINNDLTWTFESPVPNLVPMGESFTAGGSNFNNLYLSLLEDSAKPIETDTPITFRLFGQDNLTPSNNIVSLSFTMRKTAPAAGSTINILDTTDYNYKNIFRMDSGSDVSETWVLNGSITDKAIGVPSNPNNPYGAGTTYPAQFRTRNLDGLPFTVHNTALDVRILEKNQR